MSEDRPAHLRDVTGHDVDTIVLVPGLDGTAELFYRQIRPLAKDFNVVAFPLPDRRRDTMENLIDDLAGLVDEVADDGAVVCGESFGGALAMSLALRRPAAAKGLVVVNSFPYLENRLQLLLAPRLARLVPWATMPLFRRLTEHRLHSAHARDDDLIAFRKAMRNIGRDGYLRRLEILWHYDIREQLSDLSVPTLFVAGTDDRLVPSARWADFMGRRVPAAEVVLLDGYGHCCLINHDLEFATMVGRWWERAQARA